ncbi:DNA-binding transcriptional MerR regulator [Rhizobium sp. BK049]|uniref:hypothetical protein n=1 Tax=Rhizobium sp. BK049 TaxID=2587095 RepID=UPI00161631B8|nr:hypothetical protein [Rhizobium sp. BK049]MBB3352680.1 DNA-binding transcriptional MerR regulator [Rhizobium sp. BK049]
MVQSLSTRIAARLELLEKWNKNGVPPGVDRPRSLNTVRIWNDPAIGILAIGSKTKFTTTDPDVGVQVKKIKRLIDALNAKEGGQKASSATRKTSKRPYKPEKIRRLEAESETECLRRELSKVTGQWHEVRYHLEEKEKKARYLETINSELHDTIKELNERIQWLLRHLPGTRPRKV